MIYFPSPNPLHIQVADQYSDYEKSIIDLPRQFIIPLWGEQQLGIIDMAQGYG